MYYALKLWQTHSNTEHSMAKRRPKLDLESVHTISDGNGGTLQAKVLAKKQHSVMVGTRRGSKGAFRRVLAMSWQDFWKLKDAAAA